MGKTLRRSGVARAEEIQPSAKFRMLKTVQVNIAQIDASRRLHIEVLITISPTPMIPVLWIPYVTSTTSWS